MLAKLTALVAALTDVITKTGQAQTALTDLNSFLDTI